MERKIFFLVILIFLMAGLTHAQNKKISKIEFPQKYSIVVKTNPLVLLQGPIPLTNEYRIVSEVVVASNQSTEIGISILGKTPFFRFLDQNSFSGAPKIIIQGFRFQIGHRLFLNKVINGLDHNYTGFAPEGFYLGPHFSYSTARITDRFNNRLDRYFRITHTNLNFVGGYQYINQLRFTFDVFAGMGYKENYWTLHSSNTFSNLSIDNMWPYYRSNLKIVLGWNIGYAF